MFVGHALFAFAVAALVADWRDWKTRDALIVGVVAGTFAALPDVDVSYALVGVVRWATLDGAVSLPAAFWGASRSIHRSVTHSLIVGAVAAPAFGLAALWYRSRDRIALFGSVATSAALVAGSFAIGGLLAGVVMGLFVSVGTVIAGIVARESVIEPRTIAVAALWGLWSHPWGDLVTGVPPNWAFPFGSPLLESRILIHQDRTLHLLGAFAIELAVVWLAVLVMYRITDRRVIPAIDRGASVGAFYGIAALVATPPTLSVSYHFVFSILGVGLLSGVVRVVPTSAERATLDRVTWRIRPSADGFFDGILTVLAGISVALVAYTGSYLLVGHPL